MGDTGWVGLGQISDAIMRFGTIGDVAEKDASLGSASRDIVRKNRRWIETFSVADRLRRVKCSNTWIETMPEDFVTGR